MFGVGVWRHQVTRPDYRLAQGEEAIRAKDWERVTSLLEKLESSGHQNHAHLLRGTALHARQHPDLALAELNKIRDEGAIHLRAAALSGRCLLELGNLPEAHRVFSYVLAQQPDHIDSHRGLAAVAYDLGQLDLAVEHLERVAELDSADSRPHRLTGLIYKDLAEYEKAGVAYREALRRGVATGDEGKVRLELAEVLIRLGQFTGALQTLDAAPAAARENPEQVVHRAEALRGLARAKEAAELLDREIRKHETAGLFRLRGQLYLDEGNVAEAAKVLERAVALDQCDQQAHYLLAQAYAGLGRAGDAQRESARVEQLQKQLEQITNLTNEAMAKPWDAAVRVRLADLSDAMGKPDLAKMWRAAAAACAGKAP
jgi:tetratricopeptide (TPR) repeat protein